VEGLTALYMKTPARLARLVFLGTLLGSLVAPSARALDWEKTQVALTAERGADAVRTKFEFKNSSKKTVHILEVRTSCGCTEAAISSSEIPAGESGSIAVLFTIGNRTGLQEKEIFLVTDDAATPVKLGLKVTIPGKD
jgi:hypothetical protein